MAKEMPLSMVGEGRETTVRSVRGKTWCADRLREMGFVDKAKVMVIRADGSGLIVGINGTRLALSNSLANQILVTC